MTSPGPGEGRRRARPDLATLLRPTVSLPLVVGAVFLVAGAAQLTRTWQPYGDWAVAELVIRHTGRALPLSGPYSADRGYDHPLPLVYALQWLPYHLSGGRSSMGLAVTVWWNGAWLAVLVWLAARARAPWLGVLALAAVPVATGTIPAATLLLPWNPSLALVPAMVLVVVAWRVAVGSRRLLPLMVALAVWCTGAHLGFAPLAVAVSTVGVVGLVVVTVRRGGRGAVRGLLRPVLASVGVALLLTSPMLVDLARDGSDSNPARILERGGLPADAEPVATREVVKVLRAELALPPAWATPTPPYDRYLLVSPERVPIGLLIGAVVAVAAWRRRAGDEIVGVVVSLVGIAASVAGLVTIEDDGLQPWYLLSAHAASMVFWAFVVWSGGRTAVALVASRRPEADADAVPPGSVPTGWKAVALPVVALVASILVIPSLHLQPSAPGIERTVDGLEAGVVDAFEAGAPLEMAGPIGVDGYVTQALALRLDRAGFDVRVPDDDLYLFTSAMEAPEGWEGTTLALHLAVDPDSPPPEPGARLVASAPVELPLLPAAEVAQLWELPPA